MTNRERYILKMSEYDMLVKIQANIIDGCCCCVIDALTGGGYPCKDSNCQECIQKWLNKESENNDSKRIR